MLGLSLASTGRCQVHVALGRAASMKTVLSRRPGRGRAVPLSKPFRAVPGAPGVQRGGWPGEQRGSGAARGGPPHPTQHGAPGPTLSPWREWTLLGLAGSEGTCCASLARPAAGRWFLSWEHHMSRPCSSSRAHVRPPREACVRCPSDLGEVSIKSLNVCGAWCPALVVAAPCRCPAHPRDPSSPSRYVGSLARQAPACGPGEACCFLFCSVLGWLAPSSGLSRGCLDSGTARFPPILGPLSPHAGTPGPGRVARGLVCIWGSDEQCCSLEPGLVWAPARPFTAVGPGRGFSPVREDGAGLTRESWPGAVTWLY